MADGALTGVHVWAATFMILCISSGILHDQNIIQSDNRIAKLCDENIYRPPLLGNRDS